MVSDFRPNESYQFFLQEIPDLLRELEDGILNLEKNSTLPKIWELMRIAHSIKGGAACAGLAYIQEIAHSLETSFQLIGEKQAQITPTLEDLLLQSFDCLKVPILAEIKAELEDPSPFVEEAHQNWLQIRESLAPKANTLALNSEQHMTHLLLLEDVPKSLNSIEQSLKSDNDSEIYVVLSIQLQILRGLGEICNLPNFVQISDVILATLQENPNSARSIANQALLDFRAAQNLLLKKAEQSHLFPSPEDLSSIKAPHTTTQDTTTQGTTTQRSPQTSNQSFLLPSGYAEESSLLLQNAAPESAETKVISANKPEKTLPRHQSHSNIILSKQQDWDRIDTLNSLVSELIFLDNNFLTHNKNHTAILDTYSLCFNRIKNNLVVLQRWVNQTLFSQKDQTFWNSADKNRQNSSLLGQKSLEFIRVNLEATHEELSQLSENLNDLALLGQGYQQIQKHQEKHLQTVKEMLLRTQMVPVGDLLHQFHRVIRDLSTQEKKPVDLEIKDERALVEKSVLERLYHPLTHLLRNAFVHGIEDPSVREAFNKSKTGTISLKAWNQGHHTFIEISDDGRGININEIREKALEKGYISQESLPFVSEQQLYQYLFEPDFTTRNELDQLAGRGMGLYAVQTEISQMKGTISVRSQPGKGSTFVLRLPMSSKISKLVIFQVGHKKLALKVNSIVAIVLAQAQDISENNHHLFYAWGKQFVPMFSLASLGSYNYPLSSLSQEELNTTIKISESNDLEKLGDSKFPLLLISCGAQCIAIQSDEVLFERDLIIKPFTHLPFPPPQHLSGCTILGDGQLVPVLDSQFLLDKWSQVAYLPSHFPMRQSFSREILPTPPVILVVDDSLTIRNSLANTLSKANYRILQAKDGWEALQIWQKEEHIHAIICDIEMPKMNGLELLGRCRQKDQKLPFIMLTYRSNQKYRQLAKQLGATEYLSKPYLDQELLSTLKNHLLPPEIL